MKAKPGAQDISRPDFPAVVISVPGDHPNEVTVYYFTEPGPAHPAVIVEEVAPRDGKLRVRSSGYFAGAEPAFAQWFDSFRRRSLGVHDVLQPPQVLCPERQGQPCQ